MKRTFWRPIATISVLIATIAAFIYYFGSHPSVKAQLAQVPPSVLITLLAFYMGGIVALGLITMATVRLCKVQISTSESLLLTMYTSIVNFFGPLQSGPAFRAVYLKKKYGLKLKDYTAATFVYYFIFASLSVIMLLSTSLKWWLLVMVPLGLLGAKLVLGLHRLEPVIQKLDLKGFYYLAAATVLQIIVVTAIYYTELRNVAPGVRLSQAVVYTGAANLALFVSLTPGAIGFRESFLVFSQHLHHISGSAIVAANIIDRAIYVVLLLILAVIIFGTHARQQLGVKTNTKD